MNYNIVKGNLGGLLLMAALIGFTACNSDDETGKISPSDSIATVSAAADTSVKTNPLKRKGAAATYVKEDDITVKIEKDKAGYYTRTEMVPSYPGGQNSLENYINSNIQYPQEAIDNNAEGTVYVQFGVDENGNISNVSFAGQLSG